jgi:hypothetical protein
MRCRKSACRIAKMAINQIVVNSSVRAKAPVAAQHNVSLQTGSTQ